MIAGMFEQYAEPWGEIPACSLVPIDVIRQGTRIVISYRCPCGTSEHKAYRDSVSRFSASPFLHCPVTGARWLIANDSEDALRTDIILTRIFRHGMLMGVPIYFKTVH
jgi:hypothetical protein